MNSDSYKVGDIIVTTTTCKPNRWRCKVAEITEISVDILHWNCRVTDGTSNMGMYDHEIQRLATDEEILLYKLTL